MFGLPTYAPRAVHAFRGVSMEESRTGDWYMRTDVDSRIAELEAQLAAAQERNTLLQEQLAIPNAHIVNSELPDSLKEAEHD